MSDSHEQAAPTIEAFCYRCRRQRIIERPALLVVPRTADGKGWCGPRVVGLCPVCGSTCWRAVKKELAPGYVPPVIEKESDNA